MTILWEWLELGHWKPYTAAADSAIESAFQQYRSDDAQSQLSLSYGPKHYVISFRDMTQANVHTGFVRPIRRRELLEVVATDSELASDRSRGSLLGATESGTASLARLTHWRVISPSQVREQLGHSEQCSICLCELLDDAMPPDADTTTTPTTLGDAADFIVHLPQCGAHVFHAQCLVQMHRASGSRQPYLTCPVCRTCYGTRIGNQPPGTMHVAEHAGATVPGFAPNSGVLEITYTLPNGIQTAEHPSPGSPFWGTTRRAYLPATTEGRQVLELLKIAWRRRLIFTVGTSVTTGASNCVVWAGTYLHSSVAFASLSLSLSLSLSPSVRCYVLIGILVVVGNRNPSQDLNLRRCLWLS